MKQVLVRRGTVFVDEVPAPTSERGSVLVRVDHSCISVGTELSGVRASGAPLWKRALQHPDKARKLLKVAAAEGPAAALNTIRAKLDGAQATGYSAAGVVIAVGEGVNGVRPGDRVACAGAQHANHAEQILVPENLTTLIPEGLSFAEASTVTLGAIAMQGVRRANTTLGECFVVIGLGVLGQLTAQLLRAAGCRVIGSDLAPDRCRMARDLGAEATLDASAGTTIDDVRRLTDGIGADGVIITAASASSELISAAFQMCRKKGRVVIVGDVGLDLNRADIYAKELDVFISTSYGPGRYDRTYEEKGLDYPVAYVRWTEQRNMAEYLRLLADGRITVKPLIGAVLPVDQAEAAYRLAAQPTDRPPMVLLEYPRSSDGSGGAHRVDVRAQPHQGKGQIGIAVVGAGAFARGMHLPNLARQGDRYRLAAVVSRTGHNAKETAKQFGAGYASTSFEDVLADANVDAVLIATRHDLHAQLALGALRAGKHVLVEKPLALDAEQLAAVVGFYDAPATRQQPVLLTGFNRRFSPIARRMAELTATRTNPMILNYRMNAGYIPLDHWVHDEEGGGRNIGEACHIYDLFTFLTGSEVESISAHAIVPRTGFYSSADNFVATISFADGSVATLTYTALGTAAFPKEQLEVFVDGKVISMNDYQSLSVVGARVGGLPQAKAPQKGQFEELAAFARTIVEGGDWPIPLWQQRQAMEIAFEVERQIGSSVVARRDGSVESVEQNRAGG